MISISPTAPLDDILAFVKGWLRLLAEGKLQEACGQIDEPFYDNTVWTPERILQVVNHTFSPQSRFYRYHPEGPVFTDPYELEEQNLTDWLENDFDPQDDSVLYFACPIPLNHEWSDLSVLFEFRKRKDGYAVVLQDLHVL